MRVTLNYVCGRWYAKVYIDYFANLMCAGFAYVMRKQGLNSWSEEYIWVSAINLIGDVEERDKVYVRDFELCVW